MSKSSKTTLLYISRLFILLFTACTAGVFLHTNTAASEVAKPAIPKNEIQMTTRELTNIHTNYLNQSINLPITPVFATKDINKRPTLHTNTDLANLYKQINDQSKQATNKPVDGKLVIHDNKVIEFYASVSGQTTDPVATAIKLIAESTTTSDFSHLISNFQPVTYQTRPQVALADTNSLGINELLARGISNFKGSSKNRRTNIKVATEKMRGVLVAPGSTFSFNENLGDVTAKDGFVPEIVIKKDGLKPELGGGVCQVSSTVFRAVMASGMPIIERKNHSFAVSHYTPTGSDATVYTGVVDLKFTNDTETHILIWPHFPDEDTLIFDIYGTSDEREVQIKDPVKYGFQSNGSFKTNWERSVSKPGTETRIDKLISTYLPASWFKKEEKFVPAQPAPQTPVENNQMQPPPSIIVPPPATN